jgi:hypothetical protein
LKPINLYIYGISKNKTMKNIIFLFCVAILLSCEDKETVVGTEGIIANIVATNIRSNSFPWNVDESANETLKRWNIEDDGLIPIKLNNNQRAIDAINKVEDVLGIIIFDRTSIADTPDSEITRGLIVSEGTALSPNGVVDENTCGMVSEGIGTTGYPPDFLQDSGNINTVLYVHLSSTGCTASSEVSIHEIGHALGLGAHFDGFGNGPPINDNFWNVLYNIYYNPIGATESELVITKIR